MPPRTHSKTIRNKRAYAPIFAALGDVTRLALVNRLAKGDLRSITQLTQGTRLTRQAIAKHLRVLERAHLVRSVRAGRESLYELDSAPLRHVREFADVLAQRRGRTTSRPGTLARE